MTCIVVPLFIDTVVCSYKNVVIWIFAALLFIESFITIDPVTIKLFGRVNSEDRGSNIVNMSYSLYFDDSSIYNREYSYYRKMIEFILEDFEYRSDMALVFANEYSTGEQRDIMYWDNKKNKIVSSDLENAILIKFVGMDQVISPECKKLLYIFPMWTTPDYNAMTDNGEKEIIRDSTYNYKGFKVRCYEVAI